MLTQAWRVYPAWWRPTGMHNMSYGSIRVVVTVGYLIYTKAVCNVMSMYSRMCEAPASNVQVSGIAVRCIQQNYVLA